MITHYHWHACQGGNGWADLDIARFSECGYCRAGSGQASCAKGILAPESSVGETEVGVLSSTCHHKKSNLTFTALYRPNDSVVAIVISLMLLSRDCIVHCEFEQRTETKAGCTQWMARIEGAVCVGGEVTEVVQGMVTWLNATVTPERAHNYDRNNEAEVQVMYRVSWRRLVRGWEEHWILSLMQLDA
ncbi:hypothetical protein BGY98DRAFT_958880 [Russula aff. rugulosa BPL654]|nr:hypothetical protein BGY98DRAFT_958880 [Russula aff. rugulosa BPL654]